MTDLEFAAYAQIVNSAKPPSWMLSGFDEWRVEKAIRFGYQLAIYDILSQTIGNSFGNTTTIELEREELKQNNR